MSDNLRADMLLASEEHLHFLEIWPMAPVFEVGGVNIPRLFTYEFIQLLNNSWLAHALDEREPEVAEATV